MGQNVGYEGYENTAYRTYPSPNSICVEIAVPLGRPALIPVVQTTDFSHLQHLSRFRQLYRSGLRRVLGQGQVRPAPVVISNVDPEAPTT
jgi:hypothetical protein